MKMLITSPGSAEIGLLKNLLEQEGIACTVRNDALGMASGRVPFFECYPELWILHDTDFEKAEAYLAAMKSQEVVSAPWLCPQCGEENEGQFGACWQCGHEVTEETM